MVYQDAIEFATAGHGDMRALDAEVNEIVRESAIRTGIVHIFNVGSTATVGTLEFEPGLQRDLPEMLDKLMPPGRHYGHEQAWHDGNAHSHLQATVMGPSLTVPIKNGILVQGTWQQIIHMECDVRPRNRTVTVTVIGD